jgi:hypothetical protein
LIRIPVQRLNAVCSARYNILKWILFTLLICSLHSVTALAAEEGPTNCQPVLKVTLNITSLPCVGSIKARNEPGALTSEDALVRARTILWQRYTEGSPCFFNLELVSKEGLRTRLVYHLSRNREGNLIAGWSQSREVRPGPNQKGAKWGPVEEVTGATVTRNESDGGLVFTKDGRAAGKL